MSLLADLRRPFNSISLLIGIFGVLLAVYFYVASKAEREPVFQSYKPSQIFNKDSSSKAITVLDSTGKPIESNIYIAEFALWNEGEISVEAKDVRKPVRMCILGAERILDHAVVAVSIEGNDGFILTPLIIDSVPCLEIKFDFLDSGHGARFSIVYSANSQVEMKVDGNIVGSNIVDVDVQFSDQNKQHTSWLIMIATILVIGILAYQKYKGISTGSLVRLMLKLISLLVVFAVLLTWFDAFTTLYEIRTSNYPF